MSGALCVGLSNLGSDSRTERELTRSIKGQPRVLMLGPVQTSNSYGGVATVVEELALAMLRLGCEVDVASLSGGSAFAVPLEQDDMAVSIAAVRSRGRGARAFCRLLRKLRAGYYDVLVTQLAYGLANRIAPRSTRTVFVLHGFGRGGHALSRLLKQWTLVRLASSADARVANSSLTSSIFAACWGLDSTCIPLGVRVANQAAVPRWEDRQGILYVGRLTHQKKVDRLLRAVAADRHLLRLGPITIVGDGPKRKHLETLATRLGLRHLVTFSGPLARHELTGVYRRARVFVSLRDHEPLGLTYLEALAMGCAIIVPRTAGFVEHFEPWMGERVNARDIESLQGALLRLLCQPRNCIASSQRAASKWCWEKSAEALLGVLGLEPAT